MALAGCASGAADRDVFSNVYPSECTPAVLAGIYVSVIETDKVVLWKGGEQAGLYGGWTRDGVVFVKRGLDPVTNADIIRHEKTHECMYRLTGSPEWH